MVDERTRNRRGWLLFGLAILSLVLLLCTCSNSNRIETDLLSRGQAGLDSAGLDPELIRVAGRDVTLEGVVDNGDAKLAAGAAIAALPGVRLLNNNLQIAEAGVENDAEAESEAATDEARLVLELDAAEPSLSGNVDEATADLATDTLAPLGDEDAESGPDVQNLDIQAAEATPEWFSGVIALAPDYAEQVEDGRLELTPERLTLNGLVPDEEARVELGETFSIAAGDSVNIVNQLQIVAAQAPTGLTFTIDEEPDGLNLSGEVSEAAAMELSSALTPLGVNNTLELNDEVEDPAWLGDVVGLTPDFVESVDEANLSVTEDGITLEGTALSEEERAAQVEAFEQAAAGTQVTDNLQILNAAVDEDVAEEPANFRLESSEAGTRLSGTVPQSAATSLVDTLAPVTPDVRDDLETGAVSTPAWLPQLIEGLPSYTGAAQDAVLELEGETLTLSGTVDSEAQKQALGERISELSNGEAEVINNLEVVEAAAAEIEEPVAEAEEPEEASAETPAEEPAEVEALEPDAAEPAEEAVEEPTEDPVTEDPVTEEPVAEAEPEASDPEPSDPEPSDPEPSDPVEASEPSESPIPPSEPNLRIDVASGAITLSGVVPNDELKNSAAQGYAKTVNNGLELGDADEATLAPVIALGPEFAAVADRGSLNLQGDTLTLQGVVADEATRTALFDAASSAVGPNITVINRLSLASSIPQTEDGK